MDRYPTRLTGVRMYCHPRAGSKDKLFSFYSSESVLQRRGVAKTESRWLAPSSPHSANWQLPRAEQSILLFQSKSQRFAIWPKPHLSDGGPDVPGHDGPGRGGGHPHQLPLQLPPHVQPARHGPPDDQQPSNRAYKVRIS